MAPHHTAYLFFPSLLCLLFFSSLPFLSYAGAISIETVACLIRSVQMIGTHYASQQLRGRLSPFTRLPILHRKP